MDSTMDLIEQYATARVAAVRLSGNEHAETVTRAEDLRGQIERRLAPPPRMFLVWSHHHNAWWGPNHRGYTSDDRIAGRYTGEIAGVICRPQPDRTNVAVLAPECWDQPIRVGRDIAGELRGLVEAETERRRKVDEAAYGAAF